MWGSWVAPVIERQTFDFGSGSDLGCRDQAPRRTLSSAGSLLGILFLSPSAPSPVTRSQSLNKK